VLSTIAASAALLAIPLTGAIGLAQFNLQESIQRSADLITMFNMRGQTQVKVVHVFSQGDSKAWARRIDKVQLFRRSEPSPGVSYFASLVPASDRARVAAIAKTYLADYENFAAKQGYPSDYVSSSIIFTTAAAYFAVKREQFADAAYAPKVWFSLSAAMADSSPVREWSDRDKQRYADASAIFGVDLLLGSEEARKKHDTETLKHLHDYARIYMRSVWNVDFDKTSLDDFVCMTDLNKTSSCSRYKFTITSGRIGRPFEEIEREIRRMPWAHERIL
jgi:hypothetical protein